MGKYGEDSKLIYDLADQGGELLSLRWVGSRAGCVGSLQSFSSGKPPQAWEASLVSWVQFWQLLV